jgi:hypothetical protein
MLGIKQERKIDKVKAAVRDAFSYADEIARDQRLRMDLRDAMEHGADASQRIRKDVAAGSIATRLANDRKLRKKVRAMLDDLDSASDRVRRKKSHRLRNGLLVLAGAGAVAAAAIPNVRQRIADLVAGESDSADEVGVTV